MSGHLAERVMEEPLAVCMARPASPGLRLYWLGQAGFVVELAGRRLVIDPYLSDSLAEKYAGTPRPHRRMMPPPIRPQDMRSVDMVLCTHAHTDHMDPGTLPMLMAANPSACLVAPRAVLSHAAERSGLNPGRIIGVDAGERLALFPGLTLTPTRAAHETLQTDENGHHRFLGYVLAADGFTLWHSGDCVPFEGIEQEIALLNPGIALLPVNGRDPELSAHGVPGNFSLDEAVKLAAELGIGELVPHHHGMFDFNTADPARIDALASATQETRVHRAKTGVCLEWTAAR